MGRQPGATDEGGDDLPNNSQVRAAEQPLTAAVTTDPEQLELLQGRGRQRVRPEPTANCCGSLRGRRAVFGAAVMAEPLQARKRAHLALDPQTGAILTSDDADPQLHPQLVRCQIQEVSGCEQFGDVSLGHPAVAELRCGIGDIMVEEEREPVGVAEVHADLAAIPRKTEVDIA